MLFRSRRLLGQGSMREPRSGSLVSAAFCLNAARSRRTAAASTELRRGTAVAASGTLLHIFGAVESAMEPPALQRYLAHRLHSCSSTIHGSRNTLPIFIHHCFMSSVNLAIFWERFQP